VVIVGSAGVFSLRRRAELAAANGAQTGDPTKNALGDTKVGGVAGAFQKFDEFGHTIVCGAVAKAYGAGAASGLCATTAKFDPAHFTTNELETAIGQAGNHQYGAAAVTVIKSGVVVPIKTAKSIYTTVTSWF